MTVEEKLKQLHALQEIDSKVDEFQVLKGQLPIEVMDLEDEIAGLDTRVKRLTDQATELEDIENKHKENIINSNTLIERYNKQLDEVKNNREYEALTKEIELQNLENQLSEKKIRETQSNRVAKKEVLDEAQKRLDAKKQDLDTKKVELEKIIEKTEKEENKLKKEADKVRKNIEERLLKSYDRVRGRYKNGLAVVTVKRQACGGCFNRTPPQTQIEIGQYKTIIACEHCGRVLIDNEIAGIVEDEE